MTGGISIKIDKGEKAGDLADDIVNLINQKYSGVFNGYELIGVLDAVKQTCHDTVMEDEE